VRPDWEEGATEASNAVETDRTGGGVLRGRSIPEGDRLGTAAFNFAGDLADPMRAGAEMWRGERAT
jgi:hypothetical protein